MHSNSKEETITDMFKVYMERLFKGSNFRRPALNMFCPKSFQREFQNEAIIKCIEFSNTYRDEVFTDEGIGTYHQLYDVKIEIKPKDGDISLTAKTKLGRLLRQLGFSRHNHNTEGLTSFDSKKMTLSSPFSKTDRTFDFDDENLNVIPVVYLEGRINHYNDDDTPEFNELNQLCQNLFQDEVLPEIRPDLFEQNNEA